MNYGKQNIFLYLTGILGLSCTALIFFGYIFWPAPTILYRVSEIKFNRTTKLEMCSHAGLSWTPVYTCNIFILYGAGTRECQYSFEGSPNRIVLPFRGRYGNLTINWISGPWSIDIGCDGHFTALPDSNCHLKCY